MTLEADIFDGLTEAVRDLRGRTITPTRLGTTGLRQLRREVLDRSFFSARVMSASLLDELLTLAEDVAAGRINLATARWRARRVLAGMAEAMGPEEFAAVTGLDPEKALVVPEEDDLTDIRSGRRVELILDTTTRQARNRALQIDGDSEYRRTHYPAWELVRIFSRRVPRGYKAGKGGLVPVPGQDWLARAVAAASSVGYVGVSKPALAKGRIVARKDSPAWSALGAGAGGYDDAIGSGTPPFAFQSGMGWREVGRDEAEGLGIGGTPEATTGRASDTGLSPGQAEIVRAYDGMAPAMQAALRRELEEAAR